MVALLYLWAHHKTTKEEKIKFTIETFFLNSNTANGNRDIWCSTQKQAQLIF